MEVILYAALFAQLGDNKYAVREQASKFLAAASFQIAPYLPYCEDIKNPEINRRLSHLADRLEGVRVAWVKDNTYKMCDELQMSFTSGFLPFFQNTNGCRDGSIFKIP